MEDYILAYASSANILHDEAYPGVYSANRLGFFSSKALTFFTLFPSAISYFKCVNGFLSYYAVKKLL